MIPFIFKKLLRHTEYAYRNVSNIRRTLVDNKIVDHWDVDRLSALLQLYLHSQINIWLQWIGQRQLQDETRNICVLGLGASYIRELTVYILFLHIWSCGNDLLLTTGSVGGLMINVAVKLFSHCSITDALF